MSYLGFTQKNIAFFIKRALLLASSQNVNFAFLEFIEKKMIWGMLSYEGNPFATGKKLLLKLY